MNPNSRAKLLAVATVALMAGGTAQAFAVDPPKPTLSSPHTPALAGDTLTCAAPSDAPAGATLTFSWTRDGSPVTSADGVDGNPTYTVVGDDAGRSLVCLADVNGGGYQQSAPIAVDGTPTTPAPTPPAPTSGAPASTSQPVLTYFDGAWKVAPSTFPVPNDIYCDANNAFSGSPTSLAYSWYVDGSKVDGQTNQKLTLGSTDTGKRVDCRVVATNGAGSSGDVPSNTVVTAGTPATPPATPPATTPGSPTGPNVTGSVENHGRLDCNIGTADPAGYDFYWTLDNVTVPASVGYNFYIVDYTRDHAGDQIACWVRPKNTTGDYVISNSVTIPTPSVVTPPPAPATSAPFNTKQPVLTWNSPTGWAIAPSPFKGTRIYCDTGTWSDPAATFAYAWYRNGSPVAGQTANNFALAASDAGKRIDCRVTATAGGQSSGATPSNTVVVDSAAPATVASKSAQGYVIRVAAPAHVAKIQFAGADHKVAHTLKAVRIVHTKSLATYKFIRFVSKTGKAGAWYRVG